MGLQKITFDGGNVSAKTDADLYHFLLSYQVGVLQSVKSSVSFTLANNTITFQDGYVVIYGRVIYVEPNTQVAIAPDSNKNGYVVLSVNTINNSVTLSIKEQASTYPSLTRNSLIGADGIYEFPLCAYKKTTTSVAIDYSYKRETIYAFSQSIEELKQKIRSDFEPRVVEPSLISGSGIYRVYDLSSADLMRAVIVIVVNGTTHVTYATPMMFVTIGSSGGVQYQIGGTNYSMGLSYNNGALTINCGSSNHRITRVIIYRF